MHEREFFDARDTGGRISQGGHRGPWQAIGHQGRQRARVPFQGLRELLRGRGYRDKVYTAGQAEPERVRRKVQQDLSRGRTGRPSVQGYRGGQYGDRTVQGRIQPFPSP